MIKKILALCLTTALFISASLQSMEIDRSNLFAKSDLGNMRVFHDNEGNFCILKDDEVIPVENCFIDRIIRNIGNEQLDSLLGNLKTISIQGEAITLKRVPANLVKGIKITMSESQPTEEECGDIARQLSSAPNYLQISQMDNGEYSIRYKMRLVGGGPFSAAIGYWVTKIVCYSSATAVAAAAVTATGGAAAGAAGAAIGLAGAAAGAGAGAVITVGAGIAGGAVGGAVAGAAVVATTGVGIAGAAGGVVAGIETASAAVAAVLLWLPIP